MPVFHHLLFVPLFEILLSIANSELFEEVLRIVGTVDGGVPSCCGFGESVKVGQLFFGKHIMFYEGQNSIIFPFCWAPRENSKHVIRNIMASTC